jgi:hypothetical protein
MKFTFDSSNRRRIILSGIVFFSFFIIQVGLTGCGNMTDVYSPKEWRDLFAKAGGWTPLPIPDSKYRPGSIIKVTDESIWWIDDLEGGCKYPIKEFEVESYIPSINFEKKWQFDVNAILQFKGIKAGPKFEQLSSVRMEVVDHGADAIRLMKLKAWMGDPNNISKVSPVCMEQLAKVDYYMITEAFRVSKAKYTLLDKKGAAIKLETPLLIKEFLQIQPDVKYEVSSDGSMTVDRPVYFAIRKAVRVGPDFESKGSEDEIGDVKIEKLFIKSAGQ